MGTSSAKQRALYALYYVSAKTRRLTHTLSNVPSGAAVLVVALIVPSRAFGDTVASHQRTVTKLAEGVYSFATRILLIIL